MSDFSIVGSLGYKLWRLVLKALSYVELYDLVRASKGLNRLLLRDKLRNEVPRATPVDALATWIEKDTWEERVNGLCYTERLTFRRFFRTNAALAAARAGNVPFFSRLVNANREIRLFRIVPRFNGSSFFSGRERTLYRVFELRTLRGTRQNVLLGADAVVEAFNHGRLECLKQMNLLGAIHYEDVSFNVHSLMDNPLPLDVEESCLNFLFERVSSRYSNVALWRAAARDDVGMWVNWAKKDFLDHPDDFLDAGNLVTFLSNKMAERLIAKGDVDSVLLMLNAASGAEQRLMSNLAFSHAQIRRRGIMSTGSNARYLTLLAAREETPCTLRRLVDAGCGISGDVGIEAAKHGRVECLGFVLSNGGEFTKDFVFRRDPTHNTHFCACSVAASNGHLACLAYALENGCKHESWSCKKAAEHGHLECLSYLYERCKMQQVEQRGDDGLLVDTKSLLYEICFVSAANGHLDCLRYAHENGLPWNDTVCKQAAKNGHLHCLRYAHENGCEWNCDTCTAAAEHGKVDCLRYAHENGCKWDQCTLKSLLLAYNQASDSLAKHRGPGNAKDNRPFGKKPSGNWNKRPHECIFCLPRGGFGQSCEATGSGAGVQPSGAETGAGPNHETQRVNSEDVDERYCFQDAHLQARDSSSRDTSAASAKELVLLLPNLQSCLKYLLEEDAPRALVGEQDVLANVVSGDNCGFVTELVERYGLQPTDATLKKASEKGNAELLCYLLERGQKATENACLLVDCCEVAAENGCFDRMVLLNTFFNRFHTKTTTGDADSHTTVEKCSEKGLFETSSSFKILLKAAQNNHKECFRYAFCGANRPSFDYGDAQNLASELLFREWFEELDQLVSSCTFTLLIQPQTLYRLVGLGGPGGNRRYRGTSALKKAIGCMRVWWCVGFCASSVREGLLSSFLCAVENGAPCQSQVLSFAKENGEEEAIEYLNWYWGNKDALPPQATATNEAVRALDTAPEQPTRGLPTTGSREPVYVPGDTPRQAGLNSYYAYKKNTRSFFGRV